LAKEFTDAEEQLATTSKWHHIQALKVLFLQTEQNGAVNLLLH
jgi:hypothetical protein